MTSIAQVWSAARSERKTDADVRLKMIDRDRPQVRSHHPNHDTVAFVNDQGSVTTWQRTLDRQDALAVACFLIAAYYDHDEPPQPPVVKP